MAYNIPVQQPPPIIDDPQGYYQPYIVGQGPPPLPTGFQPYRPNNQNIHFPGEQFQPYTLQDPRHQRQKFDDLVNDYSQKQNIMMNNNFRSNAMLQEVETTLDVERQRMRELQRKIEDDLEAERKLRIEFETKLARMKDEMMRKDQIFQEQSIKFNQLLEDNQQLVNDNKRIHDQIQDFRETAETNARSVEEAKANLFRQQQQVDEKFRIEVERLQRENENNLDSLNKQWEFKYKALEEKCKNLLQLKAGMEQELKDMEMEISKIRIDSEEEFREKAVQIQQEEYKKFQYNIKAAENKMHISEEAREQLAIKNQQLLDEITNKEHAFREQGLHIDNTIARFKQENVDLQNQINQLNIAREGLQAELATKKNYYRKLEAENQDLKNLLQIQKEKNTENLAELEQKFNDEKRMLEEIRDKQAKKITDQEKVIFQMEKEIDRLKKEYDKLCNMLHNNIQRTINQTVNETQATRTGNIPPPQVGNRYPINQF